MYERSLPHSRVEPDDFGFPAWKGEFDGGNNDKNAPDEVIGEIGLVFVVILGIVVAVNLLLVALHLG